MREEDRAGSEEEERDRYMGENRRGGMMGKGIRMKEVTRKHLNLKYPRSTYGRGYRMRLRER